MKSELTFSKLIVPGVVMLAFWGVALWGWLASGYLQPLIMFGYIGTSIGVGLGLYATLPKQRKPHRPPPDPVPGRRCSWSASPSSWATRMRKSRASSSAC